jgi:Protein of unknown function (DUF4038)
VPRALAQKVPTIGSADRPVYPLKASANNRYLVDQNNTPFLMVGDSPQHLITNLSPKEAAAFMANRRRYGINTLWINLLCIFTEASCNREAKTFDGIVPFLVPGDIATPNPAYFQRVDDVLRIAADHGMVVLLDPIETISWLDKSRFRKSEQDDKWNFCLTTAIVAVNRRNHEQTTPPEPLTGLQGEGGSSRRQGRSHNRPAGRAFRRSPQSDHSMEIAA